MPPNLPYCFMMNDHFSVSDQLSIHITRVDRITRNHSIAVTHNDAGWISRYNLPPIRRLDPELVVLLETRDSLPPLEQGYVYDKIQDYILKTDHVSIPTTILQTLTLFWIPSGKLITSIWNGRQESLLIKDNLEWQIT